MRVSPVKVPLAAITNAVHALDLIGARPDLVAALQAGLVKAYGDTVCILSGGNIEWDGLQELLADG